MESVLVYPLITTFDQNSVFSSLILCLCLQTDLNIFEPESLFPLNLVSIFSGTLELGLPLDISDLITSEQLQIALTIAL